jgi:hypothetical protein
MNWDKISNDKILIGIYFHNLILKGKKEKNETIIYNLLNDEDDEFKPKIHKHDDNILDSLWSSHYQNEFFSCDNSGNVYFWNEKNDEKNFSFKLDNDNCAIGMDLNIYNEYSLALSW